MERVFKLLRKIKVNFEKYKHHVLYPHRSDYTSFHVYKRGAVLFSGKMEQLIQKFKDDCPQDAPIGGAGLGVFITTWLKNNGYTVERDIDTEKYQEHMNMYRQAEQQIAQTFKRDLFEEFGVMENPKKELCYQKAYENGHSGGWSEIYNTFADLVDLIQ